MKAYLVDPVANVAALADFERTEELRICRYCNFRAVCRPEVTGEPARSAATADVSASA